ncbi:heparinase II/III domain-containing protein [Hoeflea ulvae]|uniref:Heparinase II/III family protein n=1 Tax=Hoeflea ulvae TaxID=2983764 RepID=A0ABT3YKI1_9HYPH|nr:heparinase II/III family protein [Hoeflea ulvae]MCY0096403.1 heparinase II/III family protein [Hoeflea ulvae]
MNDKSPSLLRYLDDEENRFCIDLPPELVPAEHFAGSDLTRHRFSFYGESFDLPAGIDWETNPGTSQWGHDLNRFGFLVLHSPDDEQQARAMERLIIDWIRKNGPVRNPQSPYAWQNLLNIGIRIENWWRFLALRQAEGRCGFSQAEWRLVKHSVLRQLLILLRLIDERGHESNWAPIGLRAALSVLYASPKLPLRERLIRIAWRGIETAAERQVLPDGAQQELSPHYHWVALELFASCRAMARQAGRSEYRALDETIIAMARFLDSLILPDGGIVAFGDSDFDYGPRIKLFLDGLKSELPVPQAGPVSIHPYAGIAVLRNDEDGHVLAFDAGPYGTAHQHEDALSFWLTAFREHFLVDPGRYLYEYKTGSMYTHLTSTAAHSTVMIAGHGQDAKARRDSWRRTAPAGPNLSHQQGKPLLTGRYDGGYGETYPDIIHQRTIESDMTSASWLVHDQLEGKGKVPVELRFQFAPSAWSLEGNTFVCRRGEVELTLEFGSEWRPSVSEGQMSPKSGWYSPGLNRIEPAPCLLLEAEMVLPVGFTTRIEARRTGTAVLAFGGQPANVPPNAESTSGEHFMSRKPRQKTVTAAPGAAAPAPLPQAVPDALTGDTAAPPVDSGHPMRDAFARMQELLGERIDKTRDRLRSNEESFSRIADYEARIDRLEAEVRQLRQSEKALQIQSNQMSAENAVLRNRVEALQHVSAESDRLRQVIQHLHKTACEEVGRVVRALLPVKKGGLVKKNMPLSEQAQLLIDTGVVDAEWYLRRHPDVAEVGMEAAVHYVLHGAEEGRVPGPALDRAAEEK